MGRELEFKYALTAGAKAEILEKYGDFTQITMETTYYDTPDTLLGARHFTLRRRLENGVSVCTLKTPGSGGARGEWEIEAADILASIPALIAAGAPAELTQLCADGVVPVCGAKFIRLAKCISTGGSTVELALDEGILFKGEHRQPLLELEVELKDGSDADAAAFAQALAQQYGLVPEPKSKFARARNLE